MRNIVDGQIINFVERDIKLNFQKNYEYMN